MSEKSKDMLPRKMLKKGLATSEDREGNDVSDKLADKGVEGVAGIGLVKLGKWVEERMKGYKKLVARCQRMISGVTNAETLEKVKGAHQATKTSSDMTLKNGYIQKPRSGMRNITKSIMLT